MTLTDRFHMNRVVETRDASFDAETGELERGYCMSIAEWCWFCDREARHNKIAATAVTTSVLLEQYLIDIWELQPGDGYLVTKAYFHFQVPQQVWDDLHYEVGRADLEYADNYRAYRVKDDLGLPEFDSKRLRGCCGEFEASTKVDGDQWIIGCNYGH